MRIIKINEQQYKSILLGEEMHYPKFLDKLRDDVSFSLYQEISKRVKQQEYNFMFDMDCDCEYTDKITFDVTIYDGGDIKDKRQYNCFYLNEYNRLRNGKLISPKIIVNCPSENGYVVLSILKVALSHELTHLYDDWIAMKNGKSGVNYDDRNRDTSSFISNASQLGENDLYRNLSFMSYMSLKVERQAFLSQTVQELESIGCNLTNYREKIKETITYKNINTAYYKVINSIPNACYQELYACNENIILLYPKARIPKLNIKEFNLERYKTMLMKWVEYVHHETLKYYGSVVQYYINNLKEERSKITSMFII